MGIFDEFVDLETCPGCGKQLKMAVQVKMRGVSCARYERGDEVAPAILEAVRQSEADLLGIL